MRQGPFRRAEQLSDRGAPALRARRVAEHRDPFVEGQAQRVVAARRSKCALSHDAVLARHRRVFLHEAAEQLVPHDQHAGVVAIDVFRIARVVHPVVRGRVEHVFDPPQLPDCLGVHEELEAQVDRHHRDDVRGFESEPRERQPEQPHPGNRIGQALPERGGQVQPLRRVMGHMRRPQPTDAVAGAMEPVVEEILREEQGGDRPGRSRHQVEQPMPVHRMVDADHQQPGHRIGRLVHQRQRRVRQGVEAAVHARPAPAPIPGLERDQAEEYRAHAEQNPFLHDVASLLRSAGESAG